ncbi:MAG: hypothetical protein ABI605_07515 [Rhizobacter sp.]
MNTTTRKHAAQLGAALLMAWGSLPAQASCGSAFCTLMTDRYLQGAGNPHSGWSADLRVERVSQERLRSGTQNIDASQVTDEEAIERHTKNLNVVTTLGYGFDDNWSMSLRIPVVKRDHLHDPIDENTGQTTAPEQWRFTELGDVQVLARRQFTSVGASTSFALFGGLKLPTGSIAVTNADANRAERALQPGTGTTDIVIGAAGRRTLGLSDALVGQISFSAALNSHEDFRPGARVEISGAWSHAFSPQVGSVLQLNLRQRQHDRGAQAEPDNSGSTAIDLSPGLTLAVDGGSSFYVYLQVPVYQKVRGIQLVPRQSLAAGWTVDF